MADTPDIAASGVPVPDRGVDSRPRSIRSRHPLSPAVIANHISVRSNRVLDGIPAFRWLTRRQLRGLDRTELEVTARDLSPELVGLRIVWLSDLHAGSFVRRRELALVREALDEARPDLLILGGDLVNSRAWEFELLDPLLEGLDLPHGVHAVPGNHEVFHGLGEGVWNQFCRRHGIVDLTNRGVRIGSEGGTIWLCGIDDYVEGRPDLDAALAGRSESDFVLLASHNPDAFPVAAGAGVHHVLSGHTHGGQLRPFGRPIIHHSTLGFVRGTYRRGESQLYVGVGLGYSVLPVRWNCAPEMVVLELRASSD